MTDETIEPVDISEMGVQTAAGQGADLHLLNPFNGQPTGAVLRVLGYDSDVVTKASRDFTRMASRSQGPRTSADEVLDRRRVYIAQRAVVGGRGFMFKKEEVAIPSDEFRKIMANPDFSWIAQQVERFGSLRGNFQPGVQDELSSGQSTSDI